MHSPKSVGLKIGLLAVAAITLGVVGPALAQTPPTQSSPAATPQAGAAARPPNILILWGDDIGYWNISTYKQGMMGYKTPNIDRIAREGGFSPIITDSKVAPQDAPRSSPDSRRIARDC